MSNLHLENKYFLASFIDISDYAILYLPPLWLVGTSGKKSQIPIMGDLAKTTAAQRALREGRYYYWQALPV